MSSPVEALRMVGQRWGVEADVSRVGCQGRGAKGGAPRVDGGVLLNRCARKSMYPCSQGERVTEYVRQPRAHGIPRVDGMPHGP